MENACMENNVLMWLIKKILKVPHQHFNKLKKKKSELMILKRKKKIIKKNSKIPYYFFHFLAIQTQLKIIIIIIK